MANDSDRITSSSFSFMSLAMALLLASVLSLRDRERMIIFIL